MSPSQRGLSFILLPTQLGVGLHHCFLHQTLHYLPTSFLIVCLFPYPVYKLWENITGTALFLAPANGLHLESSLKEHVLHEFPPKLRIHEKDPLRFARDSPSPSLFLSQHPPQAEV